MKIRMMKMASRHACVLLAVALLFPSQKVAGDGMFRIKGHVPSKKIREARYLGKRRANERMRLAVVLKSRDQAGLDDFLRRVNDPSDALYHKYLTPEEFKARFAPSTEDVNHVQDYLARNGLNVSEVNPNRFVLTVDAPTSNVEDALQVQVNEYELEGRTAHSANNDPIFPTDVAARINAVAGLSDFVVRKPRIQRQSRALEAREIFEPRDVGSHMTPAKIRTAYNLDSVTATGAGETLAFFELAGYTPSDLTAYANHFGFTMPPLENILVDGVDGSPGNGAEEVTLDIQLAAALAPGLSKILVYEGPNTDSGVINTYARIANDNRAKQVSISWGAPEVEVGSAFLSAENTIFQQMAAQGQSVFAASGDAGAFDNSNTPTTLAVDDPASQPYVTGVGGTTLFLNINNSIKSESAWGNNLDASGGGGGVSRFWSIPSYQSRVGQNSQGHSSTRRMVPDVAINANPNTGYPIYFEGQWYVFGGTSCGAPLWAAFTALVNEQRVANGLSRLGFANPSLYQIAQSAQAAAAYNDIADFSNNLYYPSVDNYDLATGWGSPNGAGLFANLTSASLPAMLAAPSAPTNLQARAAQ